MEEKMVVTRIVKTKADPMREGHTFCYKGHVYQVYQDKDRGRHMVRHLGRVDDGPVTEDKPEALPELELDKDIFLNQEAAYHE